MNSDIHAKVIFEFISGKYLRGTQILTWIQYCSLNSYQNWCLNSTPKKKHICFENTPRRIPPGYSFFIVHRQGFQKSMERQIEHFWPHDLDLWPMTLTYELDLDILPLDLNAKIQVRMYVRSFTRVLTHGPTDTHTRCQNYYTHYVRDEGCKNCTWGFL